MFTINEPLAAPVFHSIYRVPFAGRLLARLTTDWRPSMKERYAEAQPELVGDEAERYAEGLRDIARQLIDAADALEINGQNDIWSRLTKPRRAAAAEADACRARLADAIRLMQ